MRRFAGMAMGAAAGIALAGAVQAGTIPTETARLGKAEITLKVHDFLTEEELATLRLVMTNQQALEIFLPAGEGSRGGHAALAISPDEGFIREGKPVKSAVAMAGLPDAETARTEALKACEAARTGAAQCVVALTVTPVE